MINHSCSNGYSKGYKEGYEKGKADAIEEFVEKINEYCSMSDMNRKMISQIAEQLKEQK